MAEKQLRVLIFEDNPWLMALAQKDLLGAGIEIYQKATNNDEAEAVLQELKKFKALKQLVDFVALIDMNLTHGVYSGIDGKIWISELRDIVPNLVIFSISSYKYEGLENVQHIGPNTKKMVQQVLNLG